ncbi:YchJ family protein [Microbacterium trichothecenolyticum]|uniref:SEC-C motif-containing protein n=1 Tax=Microbacterium trichothecenolyticum TaxID=69370 RepID=A0ABU0TS55_MICTR|nr:YchJ family metal-binding protein [Microbacterium trichothecenolyticum]MDQ1122474.1 SEC-C motif-containing protein [Microbacterium trichothecenolyticum]
MSFGSASTRPAAGAPCPCGAGTFGTCCGPLLDGVPAPSAERLMRSRYTAFVVGDVRHLVRSWHPRTRPDDVAADDGTRWRGLVVEEAHEEGDAATVTFRAAWTARGDDGVLREHSRFVRRGGRWVYVDGDVG